MTKRLLDRLAARLGYLPRRTDVVTHFSPTGHELWMVARVDKKRIRSTEEACRKAFRDIEESA